MICVKNVNTVQKLYMHAPMHQKKSHIGWWCTVHHKVNNIKRKHHLRWKKTIEKEDLERIFLFLLFYCLTYILLLVSRVSNLPVCTPGNAYSIVVLLSTYKFVCRNWCHFSPPGSKDYVWGFRQIGNSQV